MFKQWTDKTLISLADGQLRHALMIETDELLEQECLLFAFCTVVI